MMRIKGYHKAALMAILVISAAAGNGRGVIRPGSSLSSDSLSIPGEIYVIESEKLRRLNIDTFDDILQIAAGVSCWREGAPGSRTGFSVAGRRAVLLVNGRLTENIYTSEPLVKFVDLGRLRRVEVVYDGAFSLTGELGTGAAVNLVVEQGGREPPFTQADFTYGGSNRRARRIWFSTPRSYISAAVSYNEYLQDAIESREFGQNKLIGNDHMKSVSFDISMGGEQEALIHFTRFEDTYNGTACNPFEDIRSSGFDSWIEFSSWGLRSSIRHRGMDRERTSGKMSGLATSVDLQFDRRMGALDMRAFLKGSNYLLENRYSGVSSDPQLDNYYGGITGQVRPGGSYPMKGSVFMGRSSEAGDYLGWEAGAARLGRNGSYQRISLSRKPVIPSAAQLFHPVSAVSGLECYDITASGSPGLIPEITEEAALENRFSFGLTLNLFYRRIDERIEVDGPGGSFANTGDYDETSGIRASFREDISWRRFTLELEGGGEYFFETEGLESGVPEYRAVGNLYLSFPLFKETERMTLHLNSIAFGERNWDDDLSGRAAVHNFSLSMTLMSAVVRFQYKNFMDARYQTVPGFYMSDRHFRIGILWNLPD
ncbi:MAG: TonB-dependent receptor plug domain-containing protein [Candidatus Latescibacteria bacterium]|nr:TonB-dependent receptor plug domain-containing protein [bacterium]MBD3425389.1 TonB-dependent receptor plug domain-containing protein [Candidatus Latescibacterota bacterium]